MLATAMAGSKINKNAFKRLCDSLPLEIRQELKEKVKTKEKPSKELRKYFFENSHFCKILKDNPGTPQMLNEIYSGRIYNNNEIDFYLANNSWPSQALRFRLSAIIKNGIEIITEYIKRNCRDHFFVVNLGSGASQDLAGIFSSFALRNVFATIELVDLNYKFALDLAEKIMPKNPNQRLTLRQDNFMNLNHKGVLDVGFLIGIICSMTYKQRNKVLQTIKPYFRKSGILVVSCATPKMFLENPEAMYVLSRIVPWRLKPISMESLKKLLEENGFKPFFEFYDEPTCYHAMIAAEVL